jgi:WD40 repeat protein
MKKTLKTIVTFVLALTLGMWTLINQYNLNGNQFVAADESDDSAVTPLILKGHTELVSSADFSPDGKKVVTASRDETARIWDAETGKELVQLKGHTDWVYSADFSPDGKKVVTASEDETARIWDAETGKELVQLKGHTEWVCSADFSPDGKKVVTASDDLTARIWDAETGKELVQLKGHTDWVNSADFSPDGKKVVTASSDKTARIWDAETGKELVQLKGHTNSVYSADFSPDGKKVVTASRDETARIWDVGQPDPKIVANTADNKEKESDNKSSGITPEEFDRLKSVAENGNADAQFAVALCYFYGKGTTEDIDEAVKWFYKATKQGHKEAKELVEKLSTIAIPAQSN